jgi:hypothetical protein
MFNPDPEKFFQSIGRLKEAFQAAADGVTGPAQPKFQELNQSFTNFIDLDLGGDSLNLGAIMKAVGAARNFQKALKEVEVLARTDASAAEAFTSIRDAMSGEMQNLGGSLLGGLGGNINLEDLLGGLGGLGGFGKPQDEQEETPAPKPKRNKPKGGDFDLKGPGL